VNATGPAPLLAVVLLALLLGAAIPVLYQLYRVLRRARSLLDTAGPRLERALDQVSEAAERLHGVGSTLEAQAQALRPLLDAASRLGHLIGRSGTWLGTAMTVGGAAGPALLAGVRAFFSRTGDGRDSGGPLGRRNHADKGPGPTRRTAAGSPNAGRPAFERARDEAS
jgi:hypothetical protein